MENDNEFTRDLEKEKLRLEIVELKKPWYKKSNYLGILLSFTIAIFTIIWTFKSGIFDKKYENLKLERNILTIEIKEFNVRKDSIQKAYYLTKDSLKKLRNDFKTKELELSRNYQEKEKLIIDKLNPNYS